MSLSLYEKLQMCTSINNLKQSITTAVASVDDMLQYVWKELDYRIYIRCVSRGSYIEHL
jgi:hypothetical protein